MMPIPLRGLIPLLALYTNVPALAQEAGWVVLPVNEYTALKNKATPQLPDPAKPPADAVITRIDYTLRIQDQSASGQATLNVDVFKTGWVKVAIPTGIYVRQASLSGKPVPIVSGAIILSSPGRSAINLEVIIPLITNAAGQRLNLAPIAAGITQASLLLPKQDLEVKVTGGQLSSQSDVGVDTKLQAFAFGSEPLSFIWRKSVQENKVAMPLRQRGSLTQIVSLGEDGTSIFAEISLEVTQGAATQMKIQVPPNITINQVQGALISDWEVKSGELAVSFLEPVERSAQFVVTGETILPREGTVDVPLLRLIDVERESGGLAIDVLGAGELKDIKSQGLERADASELGATVSSRQSPSLAAFRFRPGSAPRTLTVQVARYTPQAVLTANVEEARYRVLMSVDGKTLVQARYAVRNNQRNFVRITLPAGAVIWSSSLGGVPVRPGEAGAGGILFPLTKARSAEDSQAFALEILYVIRTTAWNGKGLSSLKLPALDLPVSRTGVQIFYPPGFNVSSGTGAFRTQSYQRPSSPALNYEGPQPIAVNAPQLGQQMGNLIVDQGATQKLVDRFRERSEARKPASRLPVSISFPAVGPSLFLTSELTGENQSVTLELTYQKEKKGGSK